MAESVKYALELVDEVSAKLKKINKKLDENDTKFSKTGKSAKGFGSSISGMAPSLLKGAALIGGISTVLIATKKAFDFTTQAVFNFSGASAKLKAIVQPTTEEFKSLEKAALDLGSTTAFTASQVLDAFTEQAKLGQEVNEILASGNSILNLAAMAQLNLADAAEMTVQTLNQFELTAEETDRVVNVMAKSFTSSALDAVKFGEAMKFAGTIGKESGEEIEAVTAVLSVLADRAIDASMAGTTTRRVFLELADSSSKVSEALKKSGSSATTVEEKLKDLNKMNLSLTDTTDMFGIIASTAAKVLIENADSVSMLAEEYKNADGAAKQMAETMLDSLPGAATIMKSALEGLALTTKNVLAPALRTVMQEITDLANAWKFLLSAKDRKKQDEFNASVIVEMQELRKLRVEYEEIRNTQLAMQAQKGTLFSQDTLTDALNNIETINTEIKNLDANFRGIGSKKVAIESSVSTTTTNVTKASTIASGRGINIEKQIAAQKKLAAETQKIQEQTALMKVSGQERDLLALDQWYAAQTEKFANHKEMLSIVDGSYLERKELIQTEYQAKEEQRELEMLEKKKAWLDELAQKNEEVLAKRAADEENFRKQMMVTGIQSAMIVSNAVFTIGNKKLAREKKQQIEGIKNSKKTEEEKAKAIEAVEKAAFEKDKRRSIIQAIINGALGATKVLTQTPLPAAIPLLILQGVMTAANIAVIASQKFAKGGIVKQEAGKSAFGDQHLVRANPGEMVLTKQQQKSMGSNVNIESTIINIQGNVTQDTLDQIDTTLQDRNEEVRQTLLELSESGRISGVDF